MNQMLSTVGAMAAVAKVASTAYYYAEHFGVFNREAKGEAETRSVEVAENQSANDLREVFRYFGKIASTVVVRDEDGKSKCFGFVNFKDADDASWSIEVLNGHKFDNKEWCVRRAQKKSVKKRSSTANASK
nr:polyadenylate-binding protein 8-like [Ipomoea batatas]